MPLQGSLFGSSIRPAEAQSRDNLIETILSTEFDPRSLDGVKKEIKVKYDFEMKTREQHMKKLKDGTMEFDILVVGGGCNGAGVALDAASRGLNCAVIDAYDFASGTSSKSTKLGLGGLHWFEMMLKLQGDPIESYRLLKDGLRERNYFLQSAPYLNKEFHFLIASPSLFWTAFWFWPGTFLYHMISLKQLVSSSFSVSLSGPKFMRKGKLRERYPDVKPIHGQYGTLISETQTHDSRLLLNSLFTAAVDGYTPGQTGATLANYVELRSLIKNDKGQVIGGMCVDKMDPTGEEFAIKAKVVVNCTGVHADEIRKMDKPDAGKRIVPSRGTHLMFKKGMLKDNHGILVPQTKDGHSLFISNYFGHPMVGTTSNNFCEATH